MITAPTMEKETTITQPSPAETTAETKPKRRRKNAADGAPKAQKSKSPFPPDDYPKIFPADRAKKALFYDVQGARWLAADYLNYCYNSGSFDRTALPTAEAIVKASAGDYFCSLDLDRVFRKRHRVARYRLTEELGRLISLSADPDPIFPAGAV